MESPWEIHTGKNSLDWGNVFSMELQKQRYWSIQLFHGKALENPYTQFI